MSQTLPLDQVIKLSAVYYLSVCLLEVPSGYLSDRFGRRITLLLASAALILAHVCFIVGASFNWFAVAQFLLAAGIAMQSGSDTALHYDSLKALQRESEYAEREATAEQWGLTWLAIATLSGGALGLIDLRLAYCFSLASAVVMASLAWRIVEPSQRPGIKHQPKSFAWVLVSCISRLRDPLLAWIFGLVIILFSLAHIVFELYQPYISLLALPSFDSTQLTPLISGIVIGVSMFAGAFGARISIRCLNRLGLVGLLAAASLLQLTIVGMMAIWIHPFVLALVFVRNFPMALIHAPINAAIAPRINREQRATYLSLQSLGERFFFAMLLLLVATEMQPGIAVNAVTLTEILSSAALIGIGSLLVIFIFAGKMRQLANAPAKSG